MKARQTDGGDIVMLSGSTPLEPESRFLKHGVIVGVLRQIRVPRHPDAQMTPHESYGDMLCFLLFFCLFCFLF